jgi:signal transduction histidine kinase
MAPEDLQRAMQSFEQLDTSLSRRAGGAGLGLHLCRAIAKAHGGTLTLESQLGVGTTAMLHLPQARLIETVSTLATGPSLPVAPSLQIEQELP